MRRLLLGAAAALALASGAQAHGVAVPGVPRAGLTIGLSYPPAVAGGGGGGYVGPGDIVSGAKAWYGLRAYSAAAAAAQVPAVRLRRSSDSEQCDLKVTTSGGLSTNVSNCSLSGAGDAASWCSYSGGSCVVVTWYDQSGNATNAAAGLAAPFTFNCIGTLPCLSFDGTKALAITGLTLTHQPLTVSTVALHTSGATTQNDVLSAANGVFFYNTSGSQKIGGYFGGTAGVPISDDVFHAIQVVLNNTSSTTVNLDGAETGSLNFGTGDLQTQPWIGAQSSTPTNPLHGKLAEVGLWPTNFTVGAGGQAAQVCHNQAAYFGITASCP